MTPLQLLRLGVAFSLLATAGSSWAQTSGSMDLVIAQNGGSTATIAVAADAGRWEKRAADDLAKYIERMSGAKIPIASSPEAIAAALKVAAPVLIVGAEALKAEPSLKNALAAVAKKNSGRPRGCGGRAAGGDARPGRRHE